MVHHPFTWKPYASGSDLLYVSAEGASADHSEAAHSIRPRNAGLIPCAKQIQEGHANHWISAVITRARHPEQRYKNVSAATQTTETFRCRSGGAV
jgi:hypothetical protein